MDVWLLCTVRTNGRLCPHKTWRPRNILRLPIRPTGPVDAINVVYPREHGTTWQTNIFYGDRRNVNSDINAI